jgi:tRNA 5-methylaminomethyl-2-thiouridine biosynthesis bifunctional protein
VSSPALRPARIDFSSGVPRSLDHGDVYHAAAGAQEQARHVFLQGNGLPQRWQGRRHFCILETGFGLGHNFLATWAAWQADPLRCDDLHFVSLEHHPPSREDLAQAHRLAYQDQPSLERSSALLAAWPPLLSGLHVLGFQGPQGCAGTQPGRVHLTLVFGDAHHLLPKLVGNFDAVFLDGFAPRANPELWDPRLLRTLGRLAAPGATAATWSVAKVVRQGLQAAGFAVERAPGFAAKREMTMARFAPATPRRIPAGRPQGPWAGERCAVIIGAGLAGAMAAQALAQQGWACTVLDAAPAPAQGASGNPAGLFHGVVHRDDGVHARLHRHAALGAARHYGALIRCGAVPGRLDGLVAVRGDDPDPPQSAALQGLDLPGYAQGMTQAEASACAGVDLGGPAQHFLQGGWVDPGTVVRHALATTGVRFQGGAPVHVLQALHSPKGGDVVWRVLDDTGVELARAPLVVLAAGTGLPVLAHHLPAPLSGLGPLELTRGQLTWFSADTRLKRPVSGHGYAVSLPDGQLLCGASLRSGDTDPQLQDEDQRWNLDRLRVLTGLAPPSGAALEGRVSWRVQTPDRLPLIGPAPQADLDPTGRRDQTRFIPRHPGLFIIGALGSRGLIWAPLAARVLRAWVEATPMPLEAELLDAVDPARWLVRQARRPPAP